jgi:hypothetical protein
MYRNKSLTQWTKFSLLKILSAPPFAREHKGFQGELNRIVADTNAQFLRPLAFFYKAYARDMVRWEKALKKESIHAVDAGFTLDDIRRQIRNSKTETEQAIYYYFVLYLKDTEEEGVIKGLVFDALGSESPEVQTMGIFLIKKLYRKSLPEIIIEDMRSGRMPKTIGDEPIIIETPEKDTLSISLEGRTLGELSRIYFKLPTSEKASPEQKTDELLTDDGKIAQDKFPQFLGMPLKVEIVGKVQEDIAAMTTHLKQGEKTPSQNKNYPQSIYLITERLTVGKTIFLVIDKHFDTPIRCEVKSGGEFPYIKKLYNIAYIGNAPGTKVTYDPVTADSINNKLFLRPQVAECMKTHGFDKPTLVMKSGDILVLKNETPVKTGLIHNVVPTEYQSLYTDKTN